MEPSAHRLPGGHRVITKYDLVWFISLDLGKVTALPYSIIIPGVKVRKYFHGFLALIPLFLQIYLQNT